MKSLRFAAAQMTLLLGVAAVAALLIRDAVTRPSRGASARVGRGREVGAIRSVSGTALFKGSGAIDWTSARENLSICEKDQLQTMGGSMSIVLVDKTQPVSIAENSMVIFRSPDEGDEQEVEIEAGSLDLATLDEAHVRVRSGSTVIRSRPRYVEFVPDDGPLPTDPVQRAAMELRHAETLLRAVRKLGAAEADLVPAMEDLAEAAEQAVRGLHPAARASADRAYEHLLELLRRARRAQRAIVSVSRDEKGEIRVQAIQGEVMIQSPLKKTTLREGEGVKLSGTGNAAARRKLLDPPVLAWPAAQQTVWNSYRPALAWEALPGAVQYTVELSRDKNFTDVLFSAACGKTQWAPPMALGDGRYFWRVRGTDAERFVGLYAIGEFSVGTDRVPPALDLTLKGTWEEPR